jgi:aspartyl-tRNA(Asn)/glutamyl-tRNA(Gln) amidotransferase subunit B
MDAGKTVIGLEVHLQLKTKAKMFCTCSTEGYREAPPNTVVCEVCTAQPGAKPSAVNGEAFKAALKIALALECKPVVGEEIFVQRKHYFYPDLPSNYQRTSKPVAANGKLAGIGIREVHVEEDPGRYDLRTGRVDYNRSGIPLIEIVTEPDLTSPAHARDFLEELQAILDYLNVARDEPGSMRIDSNISIEGHPRVEVKNINSFKGVFTALTYEETRLRNLIKNNVPVVMETRHFDEAQGITLSLRVKETVADYRYIPDPDLQPLALSEKEVEDTRRLLPELPAQKRRRLATQYKITEEEAFVLSLEPEFADGFEQVCRQVDSKVAAKFMRGVLRKQLNYRGLKLRESKLTAENLGELLKLLEDKEITDKVAEQLLIVYLDKGRDAYEQSLQESKGVVVSGELSTVVERVVNENPQAAKDYLRGEEKALHFLAGKVMQATKGRAKPEEVQALIKRALPKK